MFDALVSLPALRVDFRTQWARGLTSFVMFLLMLGILRGAAAWDRKLLKVWCCACIEQSLLRQAILANGQGCPGKSAPHITLRLRLRLIRSLALRRDAAGQVQVRRGQNHHKGQMTSESSLEKSQKYARPHSPRRRTISPVVSHVYTPNLATGQPPRIHDEATSCHLLDLACCGRLSTVPKRATVRLRP